VVWTDAYADPAGAGWMVSSIAPVYRGDHLEGVVGIDVTIATIIEQVLDMRLPWSGYGVLIGRDGSVLALPPAGEHDWGLRELTAHRPGPAIEADTFKPETYNIRHRSELDALAKALAAKASGTLELELGGTAYVGSWSPVPGPGWTLLVLAPQREILANATALNRRLQWIGWSLIAVLVGFYALFSTWLIRRTRTLSREVARPIHRIENVITQIGLGQYEQKRPRYEFTELQNVGSQLVEMGHRLGEAYRAVLDTQTKLKASLEKEQRLSEAQRRFIAVISEEFRKPVAVVDGAAQLLMRQDERPAPAQVKERAANLRGAVQKLTEVMDYALAFARYDQQGLSAGFRRVALHALLREIREAVLQTFGQRANDITLDTTLMPETLLCDPAMLRVMIALIVDNAVRCSKTGDAVLIDGEIRQGHVLIRVRDHGPGMSAQALWHLAEPEARGRVGANTADAGTGLYLARTFAELHSGHLEVSSELGHGTTVALVLPLLAAGD
jgi:signal transduction histidine kinase